MIPSEITLPEGDRSYLMMNRVSHKFGSEGIDSVEAGMAKIPLEYYQRLSWEAIHGAVEVLDKSPGIDTIILDTLFREGLKSLIGEQIFPLDSESVIELCDSHSMSGIIVLEDMNLFDTLASSTLNFADSVTVYGYYGYELFYPGLLWRVYNDLGQVIFEVEYTDTLIWDQAGTTVREAIGLLPSLEIILQDGIRYAGISFGRKIAPRWGKVNRVYYSSWYSEMQKAARHVSRSEWDAAIKIWSPLTQSPDSSIASKAAFNMALASEVMDRIPMALTWINKSNNLQKDELTSIYAKVLLERRLHRYNLSKQVGVMK